jgi:hypothetical protein
LPSQGQGATSNLPSGGGPTSAQDIDASSAEQNAAPQRSVVGVRESDSDSQPSADARQKHVDAQAGADASQSASKPKAFSSDPDGAEFGTAITGLPGVFTVETAEVLPKGALTLSSYANRFSLAPGNATLLQTGVSLAAAVTSRITVFAQFEPYQYLHIDSPSQLSLNQPGACPHDVFKAPIYCGFPNPPTPPPANPAHPLPPQSSWKGPAAAFVPGFPFAAESTGDYGPVSVGVKVNLWSETRSDPLSVAVRADLIVPTESTADELADHGLQTGTFAYSFGLSLSKTLRHGIVLANNVTYLATRNPMANGETLLTPGDQVIFGQGFIIPLGSRLQLLSEYTALFPQEGHAFGLVGIDTQNTSWGPNLPVDGVWGIRWRASRTIGLEMGYRYMLNLHQVEARSGFVFSVSKGFDLPRE